MYAKASALSVRDVAEHMFEVVAAGKHSLLFECIGLSMNASQWYRLYQAINTNDNRLHLIEVFREAML